MKKRNVCVLFGGMSPEHEVSLRSAEYVLENLDPEKYNVFPVGITKEGDWVLYTGGDYSKLPTEEWMEYPKNRRAAISPVRGQGLLSFEGDCVVREQVDVVFPVLHGENGEDGTVQGLLQLAGIPFVGPRLAASAVAMDKTLTKLVADNAKIPQAAWQLVTRRDMEKRMDRTLEELEGRFDYPMFVKPAGTGSSVGVSKVRTREELREALLMAAAYDEKGPSWATTALWPASAAKLTPVRTSMTTTQNISPTPPWPTFLPGWKKTWPSRFGTWPCGCTAPSAAGA